MPYFIPLNGIIDQFLLIRSSGFCSGGLFLLGGLWYSLNSTNGKKVISIDLSPEKLLLLFRYSFGLEEVLK